MLPNQICTMSQAILFTLHLSPAINHISTLEAVRGKSSVPRLCSVYRRPEKQIAAIPKKKMKSDAMARRALRHGSEQG